MRTPLILAAPVLAPVLAVAVLPLTACDSYDRPTYVSSGYNDGYVLRDDDQIYRDANGNYYCKKPDGTTGLIVGGIAGGVLGNIIAPGGSKTLGTILGAGVGAVAGTAIDRSSIRCR